MDCRSRLLPYDRTGMFSGLVLDYLKGADQLKPFYTHPVSKEGIRSAIKARRAYPTNRKLLADVLRESYGNAATEKQLANIQLLSSPNTFTICTAHQCNIFTGYLYFVYKILHVIRIAEEMKKEEPGYDFVPVYYMGSEDNDLEELGQCKVDGVKYQWVTKQQGAVGRMKVDKAFISLLDQLETQLRVHPHGGDLLQILRDVYPLGITIAEATAQLVNKLFGHYGLLVIVADDARLKSGMRDIFTDDLLKHTPHQLVTASGARLQKNYKVQVNPREINLFYMQDGLRERIIAEGDGFRVDGTSIQFSKEALLQELQKHPEKFSPNVVLRALYQEILLPNVVFVGGGAEVAYWLELKDVFDHYQVPFPVIFLRNSFLIANADQEDRLGKMGMKIEDLFLTEHAMMDRYLERNSAELPNVHEELTMAAKLFSGLKKRAGIIDQTLVPHVEALHAKWTKQLQEAGKKMVRAEKRKHHVQQLQMGKIKSQIFPNGSLQERVENFMPYVAAMDFFFIEMLHQHSPAFDQQFIILTLSDQ